MTGAADDARLLADRAATSCIYDLPVTLDSGPDGLPRSAAVVATTSPLVLESLVGRIKVPDPIAVQISRNSKTADTIPFAWNPSYPARIGVMPREGTNADIRWFDIEPCYVFHPLNAYDDADQVVLDVVRHP